ncbi:MAG: hypothetical protein GXY43_09000 [Clostridiaceae bacterium]|nr:hypothetical protein [Clostridiaceae bacterium]
MFKLKDKELLKVFGSIAGATLLLVLSLLFLEAQNKQFERSLINSFARENEYIVGQVIDEIARNAKSEEDVLSIVRFAPSTGTRYWMLFTESRVLFEKNEDTTAIISGKNFDELENFYLRQGGSGVSGLIQLLRNGSSFSAVAMKDVWVGNEIISADYIEIDGHRYCIASGVQQNYLFSAADIGERSMILRILVIALGSVLILSVALLSIANRKKTLAIRNAKNDLIEKNLFIQRELGSQRGRPADTVGSVTDPGTGLYSLDFHEALMMKLARKHVGPIGMIVVRITNFHELSAEKDVVFVQEQIARTAAIVASHASETDICARLCANEFAITKLRSTEKLTIQSAKKLFGTLCDTNHDLKYSAGFAFRDGESSVDEVTEAAIASLKPL